MEDVVCGFCHRKNVVCGELYQKKTVNDAIVAAHHKCMKYSAGLTQYKFCNFGGFKISDVLKEQKRGRKMKCSICYPENKYKAVKGFLLRGATSGCAAKACNKSFHYYCARMSDTALTKRLAVYQMSKQRKVILYRVFCSKKHEKQFVEKRTWKEEISKDDDDDDDDDDDYDAFVNTESSSDSESSLSKSIYGNLNAHQKVKGCLVQ